MVKSGLTGAILGGLLSTLPLISHGQQRVAPDLEAAPFAPRRYVAYRSASPPAIDGRLDEPAWAAAAWTDAFVDIEGDRRPRPRFATRAKMLWDDEYFYVAAELEEPHVWATLDRARLRSSSTTTTSRSSSTPTATRTTTTSSRSTPSTRCGTCCC